MSAPQKVEIYEVGPRDGLQNESTVLSVAQKAGLVERLVAAHPAAVEVTSFVRPDRIPALADADELAAALAEQPFRAEGNGAPKVALAGLVPNMRGYERLRAAELDLVAVFLSASEGHSAANVGASVEESLAKALTVLEAARADGRRTRAYVSTAFGSPFGDEVASRARSLAEELDRAHADTIVLADTVGMATPRKVREVCASVLEEVPAERLALHMHDTYGRALANVLAGWELGIASFDAAVGGLGGCPYAPGAAGNVATEDLVSNFEAMGVATGVDLGALLEAGRFLEGVLGRRLPGKVFRALSARWCEEDVEGGSP